MSGVKKEALPLLLGQFSKFTSVYQHLFRPYLSSFLCPKWTKTYWKMYLVIVWSLFTHFKAFVAPTIMHEKLSQQ